MSSMSCLHGSFHCFYHKSRTYIHLWKGNAPSVCILWCSLCHLNSTMRFWLLMTTNHQILYTCMFSTHRQHCCWHNQITSNNTAFQQSSSAAATSIRNIHPHNQSRQRDCTTTNGIRGIYVSPVVIHRSHVSASCHYSCRWYVSLVIRTSIIPVISISHLVFQIIHDPPENSHRILISGGAHVWLKNGPLKNQGEHLCSKSCFSKQSGPPGHCFQTNLTF